MPKECEFCEEINAWKELDAQGNKKQNYYVALVAKYVRDDTGEENGKITMGNFDLKFCPECGRKL